MSVTNGWAAFSVTTIGEPHEASFEFFGTGRDRRDYQAEMEEQRQAAIEGPALVDELPVRAVGRLAWSSYWFLKSSANSATSG